MAELSSKTGESVPDPTLAGLMAIEGGDAPEAPSPDASDASAAGQGTEATAGQARDALARIPLFARLDDAERQALLQVMTRQSVAPNQTVFWRGDRGDAFYLVDRGRVAVTVPNDKGEHVLVTTLGPGGFFGEISLLDGGARTASVRAIEAAELCVLRREAFHAFIRRHPDAAIDLLTVMGQRQRVTTEALRGVKNPNVAFEQSRVSVWQLASDIIARVAASQWFTLFHICWFGVWILFNLTAMLGLLPKAWAFDPFPFGLLTMVVSLEAIFLSIFVMVSQNRQSEKDRLQIDLDYQVNLKAQTEIIALARKLEGLESRLLEEFSVRPRGDAVADPAPPRPVGQAGHG